MAGTLETLLHFDGTNGSTTFTDSTGKHTWLPESGAAIDTSQAKFGTSSVQIGQGGGAGRVDGDSTINWGNASPFTVDFWLKLNGTQGGQVNIFNVSDISVLIYIPSGGPLNYYANGVAITGTTNVTANAWHHVALSFDGATQYLFLDGHLEGTWANATNYGVSATLFPLIGYGGGFSPVGWVDELRILLGGCDWTASFTPPTGPYSGGLTAYTLPAATGAFTTTGIAAGTLYGRVLQQTTVGNFTLTGIASNSSRTYLVISTTGAFAFNGIATGLLKGDVLSMAAGTFALTGITANLIYSAGLNSYVMSASPGSFAFTGINANLVYYQLVNYVLVCGTGQFYFTGLGVGSPGQGLLSGSGLGTPVVTIPFGGAPIIDVTYLGLKAGTPVSEAAPGEGIPVTKVTTGGTPVVYI